MSFSKSAWLQRSAFVLLLALGCSAQAPSPASKTTRRITNQIRTQFNVPPTVEMTLGDRKPSELAGFDTLPVTLQDATRKKTVDFLISKDEKTLARLDKVDISSDPTSKIDLTGRPVRGNKDAKVTIINYDDFQCPFCSRMHESLAKDVLKTYGDRVKIIYKDYPLFTIHPWADHAAVNANCLNQQNGQAYWDFADYVHSNQREISGDKRPILEQTTELDRMALEQGKKNGLDATKLQACIKAQDDTAVKASSKEGDEVGVDSTPTLFVDGEKISGAVPLDVLAQIIDRALRAAGQPVPAKAPVNAEAVPPATNNPADPVPDSKKDKK
ncbi:MAG: oxidoreductase [Candidatus Angelobacter sp.]|nr:oxidoreductase [Candidatus Angelobacter sp.]